MEFRTLLAIISERYPNGQEFTSSELADYLGLPNKRISNDLVRLYQKGLLKRRRQPRRLTIWSGAPRFISCHKGYEYSYSVNKQGANYLQWMISRRNSKSQKRLDSIIQLCNEQAKTEKLRERVRELDGQKCQQENLAKNEDRGFRRYLDSQQLLDYGREGAGEKCCNLNGVLRDSSFGSLLLPRFILV